MKRFYPALAALLLTGASAPVAHAQTAAWRPFRPGLIYAYHAQPVTANDEIYTLRVDSAYATAAGDSVYAFNRLMRPTGPSEYAAHYKSRNNLFGATLQWRPGQPGFTLQAQAQAQVQNAVSIHLRPQAAVGSSWAANAQQTATLLSRSLQTIAPGVQDSVAVISIAGGSTWALSRTHGIMVGSQWLGASPVSALTMEQAALPATYSQSYYSPARLFDVQVGDEFGYEDFNSSVIYACYNTRRLRRITGRSINAATNELTITYQEQTKTWVNGWPNCGTPSVSLSPVTTQNWTLNLDNPPLWDPQGGALQLGVLGLLTREYKPVMFNNTAFYEMVGMPILSRSAGACSAVREVRYQPLYGTGYYVPGLDEQGWYYNFATGTTITSERNLMLSYSRRTVNGQLVSCGQAQLFAGILGVKAQASAVATLAPNPATEQTMLTFFKPTSQPAQLTLTDALGRRVWQAPIAAGQASATVPLAGQPAGLYLVQLQTGNAAPLTWKLTHE